MAVNQDRVIETAHFKTAEEFLNNFSPWNYSKSVLIGSLFRGQSQDYPLVPSALRKTNKRQLERHSPRQDSKSLNLRLAEDEFRTLRRFFRECDLSGLELPHCEIFRRNLYLEEDLSESPLKELSKWIPDDLFELAGLAQHYGLETRLLDWSYSPFVAAFFAFQHAVGKSENLVVWEFSAANVADITRSYSVECPFRIVVPQYAQNPNLCAQKGVFTLWQTNLHENGPSDDICRKPLESLFHLWLSEHEDKCNSYWRNPSSSKPTPIHRNVAFLRKVTLPCSEALQGMHLLKKAGFGHGSLFPGFGGVVRQIKWPIEVPTN